MDLKLTRWSLVFVLFTVTSPVLADEENTEIVFPIGEIFEPLVADPKEPQFFEGFHRVNSSGRLGRFTAAVVSYGEYFGLVRWQTATARQWQLSIVGAFWTIL